MPTTGPDTRAGRASGPAIQYELPRHLNLVHVDDDPTDHRLLLRYLSKVEHCHCTVEHIDNYSDALLRLKKGPVDIALVDYQLDQQSGLDLVEALGGRQGGTPLVLLTGRGDHDIDLKATNAGAFDYLEKSNLSPVLLERTIRHVRVQFAAERHLRESEKLLRQAKREAEDANRAKSLFMARMSHDLRTPLNAIVGFSEIIRDELHGPVSNGKYLDYVENIHESAVILHSMISEILDLTKVESGTLRLQETEFDVETLISTVARLIGPSIEVAGLSIETKLDSGLPRLCADEQMVRRILFNLLSNAIKFTPAGGKIWLRARVMAEGLTLTVQDNGIGVAPHELERIFEPFSQSDHPLSYGLGLSIVRSLIELHDGSVDVESAPGFGTRVMLSFPGKRVVAIGSQAD